MDVDSLSKPQLLLLAALDLESKGFNPFTEAQLTVNVWKMAPHKFGLPGFEQEYPDSNRVRTYLVVRKKNRTPNWRGDLMDTGSFAKVGKLLFRLTMGGRTLANEIKEGKCAGKAVSRIRLLNEDLAFLMHARSCHPFKMWMTIRKQYQYTRMDGLVFRNGQITETVFARLKRIASMVDDKEGLLLVETGEVIRRSTVDELVACATHLSTLTQHSRSRADGTEKEEANRFDRKMATTRNQTRH